MESTSLQGIIIVILHGTYFYMTRCSFCDFVMAGDEPTET